MSREAYERFCKSPTGHKWGLCDLHRAEHDKGEYFFSFNQVAWLAWQEAEKQSFVSLARRHGKTAMMTELLKPRRVPINDTVAGYIIIQARRFEDREIDLHKFRELVGAFINGEVE